MTKVRQKSAIPGGKESREMAVDEKITAVRRNRLMDRKRFHRLPLEADGTRAPRTMTTMKERRSRARRGRRGLCPNCGEDLLFEDGGTNLVACPECGFVFRKRQKIEDLP